MNSVRAIQQLNKRELESGVSTEGSWHTDYRDTAFVNVGGLPFELSEGDIITIFSQYGEPVWIKLARDKETGKSRGYAWIKYEDQRSCDLAVDNLAGSKIMDRVIRVDHARYKPQDGEDMRDNTMGELDLDPGNDTDGGDRKRRKTESESDSDEDRPLLPEEIELGRLMDKLDEDDPMRDSMIKRQQEKVDSALKKLKKAKQKEKERARRKDKHHRRDDSRDRHREKDRRRIKENGEENDRGERHSRRREHRSKSRDRDSDDDDRRKHKSRHRDDSHDRKRDRDRNHDRSRDRRDGHKDKKERDRESERNSKRRSSVSEDDRRHQSNRERRRRSPASEDDRRHSRRDRSPIPYRARSPRD